MANIKQPLTTSFPVYASLYHCTVDGTPDLTTCLVTSTASSASFNLDQQAPRYVSGSPDPGFYYDALDFTVEAMILTGGAVTVRPGTAIGLHSGHVVGFSAGAGAVFSSQGTPTNPNTFVGTPLVQERPFEYGGVVAFRLGYAPEAVGSPPVLQFRFSRFYLPMESFHFGGGFSEDFSVYMSPGGCLMDLVLRDCSLSGGLINLGKPYREFDGTGNVSWINNLFERVNLNLDPDWVAQGYPMRKDIALEARNNLFRWCRLRAVPVPATVGRWTFKDTLFDKVPIKQDYPTLPLDHDFNGYWRRDPSEMDTGDGERDTLLAVNSDGGIDTSSDTLLSSAPPYQTGPLGRHYLPATAPLYNGGSSSAGEAGLHQYTSRVDQIKDGIETELPEKVNIGLHYVAVLGGLPIDTDADGIPDYLEDSNGDGYTDAGVETSTSDQDTDDDGVIDCSDPIYAAVDLDTDGLNGLAESILGTNPIHRDAILQLIPVVTGREPQIWTFRTALSSATLPQRQASLSLVVNEHDAWIGGTSIGADGYYQLSVNTAFELPGVCLIAARLILHEPRGRSPAQGIPAVSAAASTCVGPASALRNSTPMCMNPLYAALNSPGYMPI
ncbi:MAG: hypothetical protein FJ387_28020 [Verrucomicrobia bacterium]|nr:hypothetical protein [Verrucomicrobiota bacterium]